MWEFLLKLIYNDDRKNKSEIFYFFNNLFCNKEKSNIPWSKSDFLRLGYAHIVILLMSGQRSEAGETCSMLYISMDEDLDILHCT